MNMKRRKGVSAKISSFLLALVLVFATLIIPGQMASAEVGVDEGELSIHKLSSEGVEESAQVEGKEYHGVTTNGVTLYHEYLAGAQYTIYKIGTMEQSTSTPIQVTYEPVPGLVDKGGATVTELNQSTDASQLAPTEGMKVSDITNPVITTAAGPSTVILPADGVYLIKETVSPEGVNGSTDFIISVPMYIEEEWTYEIDAYPKNTYTNAAIEKSIVVDDGEGGSEQVDVVHVNVGDTVNYQVDVTVPSDIEDVNYTKFVIKDTYSSSLEVDENTVVLETDNAGYTLSAPDDYAITNSGNVLAITFTEDGIAKLKNGDKLTVTYSATVLAGAAGNITGPAKNEVALELEIDEEEIPPIIPPVIPEVKVYAYGIKKMGTDDSDLEIPLAGAKFVVATRGNDGTYTYLDFDETTAEWDAAASKEAATVFITKTGDPGIDSEAILQFLNLDPEVTYYLVEIEAPTGYTVLPNPIAIQATEGTTDVVYNSYKEDENGNYIYQPGKINETGFSMLIKNLKSGDQAGLLPATGGGGVYMFMVIGIALIAIAAALYAVSRRRNSRN